MSTSKYYRRYMDRDCELSGKFAGGDAELEEACAQERKDHEEACAKETARWEALSEAEQLLEIASYRCKLARQAGTKAVDIAWQRLLQDVTKPGQPQVRWIERADTPLQEDVTYAGDPRMLGAAGTKLTGVRELCAYNDGWNDTLYMILWSHTKSVRDRVHQMRKHWRFEMQKLNPEVRRDILSGASLWATYNQDAVHDASVCVEEA